MAVHTTDELEADLSRHLTAIAAPAELWERIQRPRVRPTPFPAHRMIWAMACAVLVVAGMWGLRRRGDSIETSEAAQLRAWVMARTGLNLPLADDASPAVRLLGAEYKDGSTVQVRYQVGGHEATLYVSKAPRSGSKFHDVSSGSKQVSWTMRGEHYTLACAFPADLREACTICHAGGLQTVLN